MEDGEDRGKEEHKPRHQSHLQCLAEKWGSGNKYKYKYKCHD